MNGSERGGNNRRGFQRKDRDKDKERRGKDSRKKGGDSARFSKTLGLTSGQARGKPKGPMVDRPKWVPPARPSEPAPVPDCPYCGKPIRDLPAALTDRNSGEAIHFDCALERLTENENLGRGDAVTYIGAGRFGVVHFAGPNDPRGFTIKKIFEWEDRENRAEWRKSLADHYSVT
jgi:hypothetical protein